MSEKYRERLYRFNVYDSIIIWVIQFSRKLYKVFIEFISNDPTISSQLIIYHKFIIYGRVSFPPEFIDSRPSFLKIALVSSNFGVIVTVFFCSYGMFQCLPVAAVRLICM